jgi:hypothetical protein
MDNNMQICRLRTGMLHHGVRDRARERPLLGLRSSRPHFNRYDGHI